MIFKNRIIGNQVTIDLDTYFFYFLRPSEDIPTGKKQGITLNSVKERLNRMLPRIKISNLMVHYRRSSHDHVHVRISLPEPITVLDGFMIRAWMLDDQTRLELDLARYLLTDDLHEMNRCFDEKAEGDEVKKAGPWIPLSCDLEHLQNTEQKDWYEYLERWNRFIRNREKELKTDEQRTLDKI
jgi:hypothetical protein